MALPIPVLILTVSWMGLLLLPSGEAVLLNLPPSTKKCVSDEIQNNVLVLGIYNVTSEGHIHGIPAINADVIAPIGNTLYSVKNVTDGHFTFTTTQAGNYLVCFHLADYHRDVGARINLDWRIGIAARDWDSVARKEEKAKGVELTLRKHEAIVESIYETMFHLRSRELEMRIVSETTNARVAWFSVMSMAICIVVSSLQIWCVKRYFRRMKVI
ncbi:PREDICTED: transmembrane emp24 domain-containing protein p24delta3-like [Nelumbo nucifera]|uniref:GOLD domain-containing protein n=2 Tax=Nelumbo nucifera TaxID=4432 RepID=A0A822Z8C3_NELNU|nr:PREDICTED: transmembrane emp24 domain-containing protein p24delta3-like [Nelumbo nucifera]DAD39619.1 TPA_asm: hypothetical protein HUJ06_013942 [Nelumbo nucifera]